MASIASICWDCAVKKDGHFREMVEMLKPIFSKRKGRFLIKEEMKEIEDEDAIWERASDEDWAKFVREHPGT